MPVGKKMHFLFIIILLCGWFVPACASEVEEPPTITYPQPNYGDGSKKALIDRGEYLAKAGDCIACHTDGKNNGKPFAGGLGMYTPFGTFYTTNITPDKETGIGNWSDDDFVNAMREGVSPKGYNYFPAFPYLYFNRLSREDILAIKAYLFSIPAVKQENRKNDVPFPFSWRFLQHGWRLMFFQFQKGPFVEEPTQTKEWNRGAYLVQGLGHCGMCHTPSVTILGLPMAAPKTKNAFTGGFVESYFAPNISASGLEKNSVEEIVKVFTTDQKLNDAGKVGGPMADVNHNSLRYLKDEDLRAMAVYLKTVKSEIPRSGGTGGPITADTGKNLYSSKCAVCHDAGAAGAPKLTDKTAWDKILAQGMPTVMKHAIVGYNSMPPRGTCMSCSDAEMKAVVDYMVDESSKAKAAAVKPPKPRLTIADGKKVYDETCSVCHEEGKLGAPKVGDKPAWEPRIIGKGMETLFKHSIYGYNRMPPKGTCIDCSNEQVEAAVKYMVQQSKTSGDYLLW